MRVTFVTPTLAVGGAERLLSALVLGLRERDVEPTVVALGHRGRFFDELVAEGVTMSFASMSSRYDIPGILRARRAILASQPDVLVTQSLNANVIGRVVALGSRVPHVTIDHAGTGLGLTPHRRLLMRLLARSSGLVITVTETRHAALAKLGFREERLLTIPNGVPDVTLHRDPSAVRAELGIAEDQLLALFVAVLRPEKQGLRFVDAVVEARARGYPVSGVIVGAGPELPLIASRAGLEDGLRILGERDDVRDLMAAADIVCVTSRAEGLPMVVLEAMAAGRPILFTAVGGIADAVGDSGIVVGDSVTSIAGALGDAASDRARLRELGELARRRYLERFSMKRLVESYARVLREVAGQQLEGSGPPA